MNNVLVVRCLQSFGKMHLSSEASSPTIQGIRSDRLTGHATELLTVRRVNRNFVTSGGEGARFRDASVRQPMSIGRRYSAAFIEIPFQKYERA